jgi:hypothetical protein
MASSVKRVRKGRARNLIGDEVIYPWEIPRSNELDGLASVNGSRVLRDIEDMLELTVVA